MDEKNIKKMRGSKKVVIKKKNNFKKLYLVTKEMYQSILKKIKEHNYYKKYNNIYEASVNSHYPHPPTYGDNKQGNIIPKASDTVNQEKDIGNVISDNSDYVKQFYNLGGEINNEDEDEEYYEDNYFMDYLNSQSGNQNNLPEKVDLFSQNEEVNLPDKVNSFTQTEDVHFIIPKKTSDIATQTINLPKIQTSDVGTQTLNLSKDSSMQAIVLPGKLIIPKKTSDVSVQTIKIPKIKNVNVGTQTINLPKKLTKNSGTQTIEIKLPKALNKDVDVQTLNFPKVLTINPEKRKEKINQHINKGNIKRKRDSNAEREDSKSPHQEEEMIVDDDDVSNSKKNKSTHQTKQNNRDSYSEIPKVKTKIFFSKAKVRIVEEERKDQASSLINGILASNHRNAYDVLKLSKEPPISLSTLKSRFNFLSKIIHPDKTVSKNAHEAFILVRSAYLDILREINYRNRNPQKGNGVFKKWFKY